jgi:3'-5' exoribonuclease
MYLKRLLQEEGEDMKTIFTKDLNDNDVIAACFMIMKKVARENGKLIAYIGDKTGDVKAQIPDEKDTLQVGDVIWIRGFKDTILLVDEFKKETDYDITNFLPSINTPIEKIINEMEQISEEEFKTQEVKALNDYFFKNESFVERFKKGIGGLRQHHNYIGGLAEHTLNVMYMAKILAYRYDCRFKEIAVLAAKLHDIGKIEEYFVDGPFSVTMRGDMEGHIVIGLGMIEEAFRLGGDIYSEEFKNRFKGCIVQHHGKPEYGSPKATNTVEAFVVHYADYIDATFNKIELAKGTTEPGNWSEYDRRIGTRLFI